MTIEFLGTGSWKPCYPGDDTASLLVDRHILVDCGWNTIYNLIRTGVDPKEITHLFFTHMHQDHYLGLAGLMFYLMNEYHTFESISIYGPEGLSDILDRCMNFIGADRHYMGAERSHASVDMPEFHELGDNGTVRVCDTEVKYIHSVHAVSSRSYRFGDSFTYSGDTAPYPELAEFARGCDILIHESALGAKRAGSNAYFHSSAEDAADAAMKSGVSSLYLVHTLPAFRDSALEAAKKIFANSVYPSEGFIIKSEK